MSDGLHYTPAEIAVIDGVMGALYPSMRDEALKATYWSIHEHLESGYVTESDLPRIKNVLELADPGGCTTSHKEDYREYTILLLKTQAMLRQVN